MSNSIYIENVHIGEREKNPWVSSTLDNRMRYVIKILLMQKMNKFRNNTHALRTKEIEEKVSLKRLVIILIYF